MSQSRTFTAVILTSAKMVALVSTIAVAACLSRFLSKDSYGAFRQVLMLYAMASILFRTGIPQSIYFFLPRLDVSRQKGLVYQSLGLLMLFGAFIGFGLYGISDYLGQIWKSEDLPELLKVFAPYPAFMLPVMVLESALMSFERTKIVFFFNIVTKILAFFVLVVPIALGFSMVFAIRGWVIFAAIELSAAIYLVNTVLEADTVKFDWHCMKEQLVYSFPLSTAAVLGAFALYADKMAVSTLGKPEIFAVYANGAFELPIVGVIGGAITMTLLPSMVRYIKDGQTEAFINLWYRSQIRVAFILFPLCVFFFFFAKDAISLLFSRSYSQSANIFRVFLFLAPARLSSFNRIVIPLNKNWLYTFAHLIQLVVGFILCFIFYWKFGMIGAAIGLVIAVYSNISFAGYGVSRVLSIKFYRVWPFKELGKICVVAILCSGLAYISCWFIPTNTYIQLALRLIVGVLICSGTYLFITWKLKMIDWRQLKQSLGSSIKPTETISQDTF